MVDTESRSCFNAGMGNDFNNLNTRQARRIAQWLIDHDYTNVRVVERFYPEGNQLFVKYDNRCYMPRSIMTSEQFQELRNAE